MNAFTTGNKELIEYLLEQGADVEMKNCYRENAFDLINPFLKHDKDWIDRIVKAYYYGAETPIHDKKIARFNCLKTIT